ncbi:MAG: BrnT family toxin [Deltaproteobacteria bacterium]|nr:BrnT family toxin [Deltaproteobacteria bacterium]
MAEREEIRLDCGWCAAGLARFVDDSARGEQRFVSIGMNTFGRVMVVVYTYEGEDTRLISVRHAEPKERRAYEKGV